MGQTVQDRFNTEFANFFNTQMGSSVTQSFSSKPSVNKCRLTKRGESTESGKKINDMSTFALNFMSQNRAQTNVLTPVTVSSQYCPFKTISCNSTTRYQSFDGTCNNLKNPLLGSVNTPYKRYLSPAYDDTFNSYRRLAVSGKELPNPRYVSVSISRPNPRFETNASHLLPLFGQFLAHDITGQSATTDSTGVEIDCPCGSTGPSCMSYSVPVNDTVFKTSCMKFTRSSASFSSLNCTQSYREQLNIYTSFIDGSAIYGNSLDKSKTLRTLSGGQLKTSTGIQASSLGVTNRPYLPLSEDTCNDQGTRKCFFAGEHRTSENLGLVSIQTLFIREHNRIATELIKINPTWTDEKLYLETRRIIIALVQHIVYNEWLPVVTGNRTLSPLATNTYYSGYNENVNPSIANDFASSAFRFGHSLIIDIQARFDKNQNRLGRPINYDSVIFKTDLAYDTFNGGLNSILIGLLNEPAWKFGTYSNLMQNHLFEFLNTDGSLFAIDLLATNLNRGRDHGLPNYAKYVEKCTGTKPLSMRDLRRIQDGRKNDILSILYGNVNDIDFYAGGLAEIVLPNAVVGTTFACIIMEQFKDLKNGDRFYYENGPSATSFTLEQLAEIKKIKMSTLLCNNYDLTSIQPNSFYISSTANARVNCSSFSQMDFSKWRNN